MIRFVIFVSTGNDGTAMCQWAYEQNLTDVAVVYTDTGWSAEGWSERVDKFETWVQSMGWEFHRTHSIGFAELARRKKGFPTQRYQWCSYVLKIEPGERWLAENDPDKIAICLVGVRREESQDRANFPLFLLNSENHGGRVMVAPMAQWNEETRNSYILRAGWDILPHRSRECKCINSKKADIQRFTDKDREDIRSLENEIGRPLFRPHRHLGAKGIDEMIKWANSSHGGYRAARDSELMLFPDEPNAMNQMDDLPEENISGGCDTFGGCGT